MGNPWESRQEKTARIKREVMTHFSYHHMYELCDDSLYHAAISVLKAKHIAATFGTLTAEMKRIWRIENGIREKNKRCI